MDPKEELASAFQNLAENIRTGKYGTGDDLDTSALQDDVDDILAEWC